MARNNSRRRPRRRPTAAEAQQALARIKNGFSHNDETVIRQFAERGIDPADIDPRGNVFTMTAWRALGRRIGRGATALRVPSFAPVGEPDENGRQRTRPTTAKLFHVSQTVPIDAPAGTRPPAWNNPALVKPGTYPPTEQADELPAGADPDALALAADPSAAPLTIDPAPRTTPQPPSAPEPQPEAEPTAEAEPTPQQQRPAGQAARIEYEACAWFGERSKRDPCERTGPDENAAIVATLAALNRSGALNHCRNLSVTRWQVVADGSRQCCPLDDIRHLTLGEALKIAAGEQNAQAARDFIAAARRVSDAVAQRPTDRQAEPAAQAAFPF